MAIVSDLLTPFKLNIISYPYQLDKSISVLKVAGWSVLFLSIFKRNFNKQTVENLIRCRDFAAFVVFVHCLIMSQKKDARLVVYSHLVLVQ